MPYRTDWKISLNADQVLRAQGADPNVIRARRPALVQIAEQALQIGQPLLKPAVLYTILLVRAIRHEKIQLEKPGNGSAILSSALIVDHLASAEKIAAVLCTVGEQLEKKALEQMEQDPLLGLALDAVGSAAAEALGNQVCAYLEAEAQKDGLETSIPLSPGMIDWPVSEGQPQIFKLLETEQQHLDVPLVELTSSFVMKPRKSVSFILGFGRQLQKQGRTCDYCAMKETCRYQEQYARETTHPQIILSQPATSWTPDRS